MPISGRNRPPGSKMRRTLPGWLISNRGSGSRNGTTPFLPSPPRVGGGHGLQPLRRAVHAVALAVPGALDGHGAVVVQGGAPEHAAVRHHALAVRAALPWGGSRGAAADVGDAEVAGVDEADELGRFVVEQRVASGPGWPTSARTAGSAGCTWAWFLSRQFGVAAVAVGAAEAERVLAVRVADALVAGHAADATWRAPRPAVCFISSTPASSGGIGNGSAGSVDQSGFLRSRTPPAGARTGAGAAGSGAGCRAYAATPPSPARHASGRNRAHTRATDPRRGGRVCEVGTGVVDVSAASMRHLPRKDRGTRREPGYTAARGGVKGSSDGFAVLRGGQTWAAWRTRFADWCLRRAGRGLFWPETPPAVRNSPDARPSALTFGGAGN